MFDNSIIRPSHPDDMPQIMAMIDHSRGIMRTNGNQSQWDGYPTEQTIRNDMEQGIGYVIVESDRLVGCFTLLDTPEPTYAYIEGGSWIDDTTPYRTLHRLACAPGCHGIAQRAFDWSERQAACVRMDTHLDNHIMLHIIKSRGYTRCGVVYMNDGSPRDAFQKMMYPMVRQELKAYVEQEILPRYNHFDSAHQLDHIQRVMAQSLELSQYFPELDKEMIYTIAAYHDTGVVEGRERHHLVSGRIIREDQHLPQWFDRQQIETMAQAAEDHRASAHGDPRSLYGMIVAEADRDIQPLLIIQRTIQYGLDHYPALSHEEQWQRMLTHLHEKYAPGGYLKFYIPQSRNRQQMEKLQTLIANEAQLREIFESEIKKQKPKS